MNALRAFSAYAVLVACIFVAFSTVAQDPGQTTSAPPKIQGPPGGPLALPPAPAGGDAQQSPLKFKMYALLGQKTANKSAALDPDLKPIESALKTLPYTEYQKISVEEHETQNGTATQFTINPVYTLVIEPQGNDQQGAAQLDIHVDFMQDDGKTISALRTHAAAKSGDALLMHGMPLSPGELVIALVNVPGDQQSQGGKSDQNQDQKDQQQQKQDQDDQSKDKDKQDQKKDEEKKEAQQAEQKEAKPDQQDKDNKDEAEKKDKGSLESILQSLENTDRKEQEEVRNKRDRIDFKGDWW